MFFPPEISNSFLSVFIAWLNLDLGIEVCFYNGLDSYAKTWLQLVFPLYIWITVGGIIVVRRYSVTISKTTPNNQLQILATVSLLAYTKFLQVIITAFSYAVLQYSDDLNKTVWLYDGNVEFFTGRHLLLFSYSVFPISHSTHHSFYTLFVMHSGIRTPGDVKVSFDILDPKSYTILRHLQ